MSVILNFDEFIVEVGDTNVVIKKEGEGTLLKERSLVAYNIVNDKIKIIAIGNKAASDEVRITSDIIVESPIECGEIKNFELAYLMLDHFFGVLTSKYGRLRKIKATFYLSMGLSEEKLFEYKQLAIECGVSSYKFKAKILDEFDELSTSSDGVALNIGSETTEFAIINKDDIVLGYNLKIGSRIIDSALTKYFLDKHGLLISEFTAENIKVNIASLYEKDISKIIITGTTMDTREKKSMPVFSREIYPLVKNAYLKICDAIKLILNDLSAEQAMLIATHGITLLGGGSKVKGLDKFFENELNVEIK